MRRRLAILFTTRGLVGGAFAGGLALRVLAQPGVVEVKWVVTMSFEAEKVVTI